MSKPYVLKTIEDLRHESVEIALLAKNQWIDHPTVANLIKHVIDTAYCCGKADQAKEQLDRYMTEVNTLTEWKESS